MKYTFRHGSQSEDGNFTGSLGTLENEQVDLLGNPRLIANYNTTKSLFLQPITMMRLSFIIKRRPTFKMLIISVYSQFDEVSTILGITFSVVFPFIYFIISKSEMEILKPGGKSGSLTKTITYVFALLQNVSMKHSKLNASRIVVASILFYTLITSSLFQSSITKNLNTNQVKGRITSVDALIKNNFQIRMPPYIVPIFRDRTSLNKVNELMRHSRQTIEDVKQPIEFFDDVLQHNDHYAYLWSDFYVDNYLNQFYDSDTGENILEHIPEVVYEFYISLMAPKSSPFIEKFNEFLLQFVETGLGQYHVSRAKADADMIWIWRILNGKTPRPPDKAIKWNDVQPLFQIYFCFCGASFIVFVIENLTHRLEIVLGRKSKVPKENASTKIRKLKRKEKCAIFNPTKEFENAVLKLNRKF